MTRVAFSLSAPLLALLLGGCIQTQTSQPESGPKYELATLVSGQIRKCWFGAGGSGFSAYAAESDINPQFKRARILLLPKDDLEAKPLLVIEAVNKNASRATISAYGPMMQGAQGNRITADLNRWTSGSQACS
uniref:hypothetical protein n=1 Tax=Pararhizobium sp. IMCC3301 TaxID=3067904 RepID=UPI002741E6D1|nr:hypothetical protein [Pararhizobium sp. IMCC3301]